MTPAIKNTVARIRKKFDNPDIIENVYGVGYKFPQK
jgi:DNA-binding response OmpR family regulator